MLDVLQVAHVATAANNCVRADGDQTLDILEACERAVGRCELLESVIGTCGRV